MAPLLSDGWAAKAWIGPQQEHAFAALLVQEET
jgi:hypothetical protein